MSKEEVSGTTVLITGIGLISSGSGLFSVDFNVGLATTVSGMFLTIVGVYLLKKGFVKSVMKACGLLVKE